MYWEPDSSAYWIKSVPTGFVVIRWGFHSSVMHVNEIRNNNVHCWFYLCDCKLLTCPLKTKTSIFVYLSLSSYSAAEVWWNALLRGSLLVGFQWQTHMFHIQLASQCSPQSPANLCVLKGMMELWARLRGDDGRAADGSRLRWCVSQPPSKWRLGPEILS